MLAPGEPDLDRPCPRCGGRLRHRGQIDGRTPDGGPINLVLWRCTNCQGRFSATVDLRDARAVGAMTPEPWTDEMPWPG